MNKQPNGKQRENHLNECRQLILKATQGKLAAYVENLETKLFELADKAESNREQTRFFEARKLLIEQKSGLNARFVHHIHAAYKAYAHHKATVSKDFLNNLSQQDSLSLVEESELEEAIALSSMSRKAEAKNAEELYALNQRLTTIRGGKKISLHHSPVEPSVFAEAIQLAIEPIEFDTKSKLVILKLFDTKIMSWLGKLYENLNQHLAGAGILTHLRYKINKSASGVAEAEPEQQQGTQATNNQENETLSPQEQLLRQQQQQRSLLSANHQQQLLNTIQQMQTTRLEQQGIVTIALPYTQQELINSLSNIQLQNITQFDDPNSPILVFNDGTTQLQDQLLASIKNTKDDDSKKKQFSQLDADLIEIVGLLFDYMLNADDLPDAAKALLSYLHTPFLKLALQDKAFFEHPKHPARQLLNSLVEAGERWLETGGKHRNIVFNEMRTVVQRILSEFKNDASLFPELAFEFAGFIRQHERRVRITEDRARQAAKGEDKLREIRAKVTLELDERTTGRRLPLPIITLLYEPWANYLSFNLLRFGKSSDELQAALKVVDEVLWYIEPKQSWVGKKASGEMADPLEELIRKGFETVGYDETKGETLIKSLKLCQRLSVDGIKDPEQLPPIYDPQDHHPAETLNEEEKAIVEQLVNLEFGTWFMFDDNNPEKRRSAKLAWHNANTMHFMFVNKLGHQVAVRSAKELAQQIIAKELRILDSDEGKPFFEKALERILQQMNIKNT